MKKLKASRCASTISFHLCSGLILLFLALSTLAIAEEPAQDSVDFSWSEFDGQRFEIYFTTVRNNKAEEKVQLTNDQYNNMHPSLAVSDNGTVWLVWTALNGENNKLFYARRTDGTWSFPKEIETGIQSGIAPTIVIGPDGMPWITWAGFNGKNDDIYVSRWDGENWTPAQRIHPANTTPDILPIITLEGGRLLITWQGYDGDQYQYYTSEWTGKNWTEPQLENSVDKEIREQKLEKQKALQSNISLDIKPVGKPALHVQ